MILKSLETKFQFLKEAKMQEDEQQMTELQRWEEEQQRKKEERKESLKKNSGAFGIFDKIYRYLNKDSRDEREGENEGMEESDRKLLYGDVRNERPGAEKAMKNLDYIHQINRQRIPTFKELNQQQLDKLQEIRNIRSGLTPPRSNDTNVLATQS